MKNPFVKVLDKEVYKNIDNEYRYIDAECSMNKVVLAKLPVRGIEPEIEGCMAGDIFSTKVINDYIKDNAKYLKIDVTNANSKELSKVVSLYLESNNKELNSKANEIVKKFGHRLGLILLTLKTGLKENREARRNWTDEHWKYWAQLENVILVGGLANGIFGEKLKEYALEVFKMANVKPYNILLFSNSSHIGIMGCATQIKQKDGRFLVFDFGQTNVKRGVVEKKNGHVVSEKRLDNIPSLHMQIIFDDPKEEESESHLLDRFIVKTITDTYKEVDKKGSHLKNEIIMGIANYTVAGKLNAVRGGYCKMSGIADNYADYLSNKLSGILGENEKVTLIHDGTANALYFKQYKNSVCISMGTAFGVGFPLQ